MKVNFVGNSRAELSHRQICDAARRQRLLLIEGLDDIGALPADAVPTAYRTFKYIVK